MKVWIQLLLAILSGLLLMLSWPNPWVPRLSATPGWLAWVALIPFLLGWKKSRPSSAFISGFFLGFSCFLIMLYWLLLINRDTPRDNLVALLFFVICGGIYIGLFSASARWVSLRLKWPEALVLPLAWTAWEYLRGHILIGGWPWASLGHTQYANPMIRQLAAAVGVGGISFLIVMVNAGLTQGLGIFFPGLKSGSADPGQESSWRCLQRQPVLMLGLVGLLALGMVFVLLVIQESIQFSRAPKTALHLALIQGNINTNQKWNRAYKTQAMQRMTRLHHQAAASRPDLIIWAESCFPGILEYELESEWEEQLRALIRSEGIRTVITSNEYQRDYDLEGEQYHHYNSSFFLGPQGETLGRYRKIKLVPFGEYLPFRFLALLTRTLIREPLPVDFEPGQEYTVFVIKGIAFSPLICYEDHFEELGYGLASRGARFFAALANDAWSGKSAMSVQHTSMSVFLAIEHRAYIAKANMTGPTCVIDPWGNISPALPGFTEGIKFETIYPAPFRTFFTRHGNIFPFSCLLVFGMLLLASFFKARSNTPHPS